jgi:aminoglycoside 2'-N-acetyltransferase I
MQQDLRFELTPVDKLSSHQAASVYALCRRAYDEDPQLLLASFTGGIHVLGFLGVTLVSHAMWVTRWLQPGDSPRLRCAYVEMVATEPHLQRHGLGTAVMRRLAGEILDYDLGALCPAEPRFYARLDWVPWRGPLFARLGDRLLPTPDELVMILRLPKTPALDLDQPLSVEWRAGEIW